MTRPLILFFFLLGLLFCGVAMGQQAPAVVKGTPARSTPRETVWSFLWWLQNKEGQRMPELAAQCLDLSRIEDSDAPGRLAIQLKRWVDAKGLYLDYEQLSDDPDFIDPKGREHRYWLSSGSEFQKIYLWKKGSLWLFSAETVAIIPELYQKEFPWIVDFVLNHLPKPFQTEIPLLSVKVWQLMGLLFLLAFSYLLGRGARWLFDHPLRRLVSRTKTRWDDLVFDSFSKPLTLLATTGVLAWTFPLLLLASVNQFASETLGALAMLAFVWGAYRFSDRFVEELKKRSQGTSGRFDDHLIPLVRIGLRVLVLSLGLVLILQSLGINVGALVAGLGIGGLAVALAAQNVLGDLFASGSIALDKPFAVGDFIVFGNFMGTVEYIGLKTTRVRSLTGEQLVFSNAELVKGPVQNFKRMQERRVSFSFGVTYQTSHKQLEAIPQLIREIVLVQGQTRFDRAHFRKYGDSSLDFEVVYWVTNPDYNQYMDIQQAINLAMFQRFAENKIEFAYPTRTLFVETAPTGNKAQ